MLRKVLTDAELQALLGDSTPGKDDREPRHYLQPALHDDASALVRSLVHNQLHLMRMIEEMQLEIRSLRSIIEFGPVVREAAPVKEPAAQLPLRRSPISLERSDAPAGEPASELSRKDRFKRKSIW